MIIKVPNNNKSRAPMLHQLLQYLENDANKKREDALYIDGFNEIDIESESYYKNYWHGIIAPSELECQELTAHYISDDSHYAATQHGQQLVDKLQSELDFNENISTAIHWRRNNDGTTYWHYHLVGLGRPTSRLDTQNGALQEAWCKASITKDKSIVNYQEHQLELNAIKELIEVNRKYRNLTSTRCTAVKAASITDKMAIRVSFNELENKLIDQRFILKQKVLEYHHSARADSDSIGHQIARQNNGNERNSALTRMTNRGLDLATIMANKKNTTK